MQRGFKWHWSVGSWPCFGCLSGTLWFGHSRYVQGAWQFGGNQEGCHGCGEGNLQVSMVVVEGTGRVAMVVTVVLVCWCWCQYEGRHCCLG